MSGTDNTIARAAENETAENETAENGSGENAGLTREELAARLAEAGFEGPYPDDPICSLDPEGGRLLYHPERGTVVYATSAPSGASYAVFSVSDDETERAARVHGRSGLFDFSRTRDLEDFKALSAADQLLGLDMFAGFLASKGQRAGAGSPSRALALLGLEG